jgi:hypothetical protein
MSSEDVLRADEALPLDARWPGLDDDSKTTFLVDPKWPGLGSQPADKFFKTSVMKAVATDLELSLGAMNGGANAEGYTGSINSIRENCNLTEAQMGHWDAASALTQSVGAPGGKKQFEEAYGEFIAAYEAAIRAIREHARELDDTEYGNADG